jgi:hypothetical protein
MPAQRLAWLQGRLVLLPLLLLVATDIAHAEDWLPISQDELSMRSTPKAPNAPAIYLYREVDRDDNGPSETTYERIKILTEEGRDSANIEIPYTKGLESIRSIRARTIRPDGGIVNFDGEIFDKSILKVAGAQYSAKTFTLPNVEVGSIIEYRYRHDFAPYFVFNSQWILSQSLFTQHARFSLQRYAGFVLRYAWPNGIPPGSTPPKNESGKIRMEVHDVPAFLSEEYMPPENELKFRVDFIYDAGDLAHEKDAASYWKAFGQKNYRSVEKFIDRSRAMNAVVSQVISADDSEEAKLQKIYARTQLIRNLTFERSRSEQETKRENLKDAANVEDVWTHGYGYGSEITWLFLAMVRAAGFEAYPVLVSTRNKYFFNADMMNARTLNDNVVQVSVSGKQMYFDPGARYTPYGQLPWFETAVAARRLDKDGGEWITTVLPSSDTNHVERKATFKLSSNGTLEGTVAVTFTGQEAMSRRLDQGLEDDAGRKQFLEDELKASMPTDAEVQLINNPEWDGSSASLDARYTVRISGWATGVGSRLLLPVGLFTARQKATFLHTGREHPIYFQFPTEVDDEVSIEIPKDWKVDSLPQASTISNKAYGYAASYQEANGSVHLQRSFRLDMTIVNVKYYGMLQAFFQKVRSADEEQAILTRITHTAAR